MPHSNKTSNKQLALTRVNEKYFLPTIAIWSLGDEIRDKGESY